MSGSRKTSTDAYGSSEIGDWVKGLATDRYPPFTLARADYPAGIEVAYPEHPSRGLVLVKWLLAVPHLVVVGLIAAPILPWWWTDIDWTAGFQSIGGYSMLNLLAVLAGFLLLITGAYPRSLFDLMIGINRWCYRVLTYVALMHDEYPPFRLDQGAHETVAGDLEAQRTRFTGRIATAPSMAAAPPTAYSTP